MTAKVDIQGKTKKKTNAIIEAIFSLEILPFTASEGLYLLHYKLNLYVLCLIFFILTTIFFI